MSLCLSMYGLQELNCKAAVESGSLWNFTIFPGHLTTPDTQLCTSYLQIWGQIIILNNAIFIISRTKILLCYFGCLLTSFLSFLSEIWQNSSLDYDRNKRGDKQRNFTVHLQIKDLFHTVVKMKRQQATSPESLGWQYDGFIWCLS